MEDVVVLDSSNKLQKLLIFLGYNNQIIRLVYEIYGICYDGT